MRRIVLLEKVLVYWWGLVQNRKGYFSPYLLNRKPVPASREGYYKYFYRENYHTVEKRKVGGKEQNVTVLRSRKKYVEVPFEQWDRLRYFAQKQNKKIERRYSLIFNKTAEQIRGFINKEENYQVKAFYDFSGSAEITALTSSVKNSSGIATALDEGSAEVIFSRLVNIFS